MLRAGAELASGLNLASLADVAAKSGDVLVVDVDDVIHAELTDLSARTEASTATAASGASSTGAAAAKWATTAWSVIAITLTLRPVVTIALALRTAEARSAAWGVRALARLPGFIGWSLIVTHLSFLLVSNDACCHGWVDADTDLKRNFVEVV